MNNRIAAFALVAMLMVLAVPLSFSDDGDAISQNGIDVTIRGGGDSLSIDIESGSSKTTTLYVKNNTDRYYDLTMATVNGENVSVEGDISINNARNSMLYPSGDDNGRDIATLTVTITTDKMADDEVVKDSLVLKLTAIGGSADSFTILVPYTINVESIFSSADSFNKFFGIIPNTLPHPFNNEWVTSALTLILWIVATIIVCEIVIPLFAGIVRFKKSKDEKKELTHKLTKMISLLMFVVAANECLAIVGANSEVMSTVSTLSLVLYVIIGAAIAWQVYIFIISTVLKGLDETVDVDGVDSSLLPLFKMVGKLVICVVGATIILAAYGVDLAGIMVSAGVITLGITFGAQQIISQFFSGIVLLATRPFKKDDFVNIGGTTYKVHNVRLMYTEFENWDGDQIITMPNNTVSAATLVNYTKNDKNTRIFVYMDVAYDADLTKAKELMVKGALMHPHVVKDGTVSMPSTRLTKFLDSGIEYRLACFVDDYDSSSHYAGQIREIIYKLFLDNNIEIPYNRLQIDILSSCDGKKREDDETPVE